MRTARTWSRFASVAVLALVAASCDDGETAMCIGVPDGTATCESACDRLYAEECLVGTDRDECVTLCAAAVAPLAPATRDRVLGCYVAAVSCAQVDGCSRACGEGGNLVIFGDTDGAVPELDAGPPPPDDAAPPPPDDDAGPPPDDAG